VQWLALAAAALVGGLSLTACGATSAVSTPVADAATKTVDAGSEHVEYTGSVSVGGQKMQMTGVGDFQNDPKLGGLSIKMDGAGQHATVDTVLSGSTVYMRSPLFSKVVPSGKWLALDLDKAGKQLGVDVTQFAQQSPTDTLQALKKAGSVTKVGDETVDGVSTTHYRALIHPVRIGSLQGTGRIPIDVWIDGDGLLRRLTESFSARAAGQTAATSVTMNLSDYGEKVFVKVPSADETLDMTKLGG
jgi:hypothetical protein